MMKPNTNNKTLTIAAIIVGFFLMAMTAQAQVNQSGVPSRPSLPSSPPQLLPYGPSSPGAPSYTPIPPQTPPTGQPAPLTTLPERGAIDPRTGEMLPGTSGGVINPKTG